MQPTNPAGDGTVRTLSQRFVRVISYFSTPRKMWLVLFSSVLAGAMLEPAIPALLKPLLDNGFNARKIPILLVPLVIIGLFTLRASTSLLADIALAKIAQVSLRMLREKMFLRVNSASLELYRNQPATTLANTIVFEANNGAILLLQSATTLVKDSLSILALLGYLLFLNWKLTIIVACIFPAIALAMRAFAKRLYRLTKEAQSATDLLAYVVEENVLAHKEIRLQGAQETQAKRFMRVNRMLEKIAMKSAVAGSAVTPITHIFGAIALSAVITVALVQSQSSSLSAGGFVSFITAMLMLIAPLKHLSEVSSTVTRGLVAAERAISLVEAVELESSGQYTCERCDGPLEFRNVSLTYPGSETPALAEVNLTIQPRQFIALVGLSGSGKTSLVNLLPRFVGQSSGEVFLGGVDIRDWDIGCLRRQFASVGQHVVMLNDSVLNNIVLGQPIDRQRAADCLAAAYLNELVDTLPLGIDTVLGHNASLLSGGERQRLAIARALYKNAPILLLDEATSALDPDTDSLVQAALRTTMAGRTTIAIAHRLSTVRDADLILVLQNGRIVQRGTHHSLEAESGTYRDFVRLSYA